MMSTGDHRTVGRARFATSRLLTPEEIAVRAGSDPAFLRPPTRITVFAERETRLRHRAVDHPIGDFLEFMAVVARSQHDLLQRFPEVALPDAGALADAALLGLPPLPAALWPRDPAWLAGLQAIVEPLTRYTERPAVAAAARLLREADPQWIERQADRLLNGVMLGLDLATAPLICSALQVYWTHLVLATENAHAGAHRPAFGRVDDATLCPCCGSRPTASVTHIGADESGLRYLHCSLCSMQWHMVRIKCTRCERTGGIEYLSRANPAHQSPEGGKVKSPVEAETCGGCGHYLKIVRMERDAYVDPVADDLATVDLDLAVAGAGFERHGVNPLLLFGRAKDDGDET